MILKFSSTFLYLMPNAQIKPGRETLKNPDVFKDPDVWCQVNKTSRISTNFFHFHPDVWCHIDTVLICSAVITVFFNIICQYLNPFFTKLSRKILFNSCTGENTNFFFSRNKKYNAQCTHNPKTPTRMVPIAQCRKTLRICVFKSWTIIQLKRLQWQLNFNWPARTNFNSSK